MRISIKQRVQLLERLNNLGISVSDAEAIRLIARTLHRGYEGECGNSNEFASWCIVRGRKENNEFIHDDDGNPYEERHLHHQTKAIYTRIPDRERRAKERLVKIMARYPDLWVYHQTDPRGAPLYVGKHNPATVGADPHLYYSQHGVAVL